MRARGWRGMKSGEYTLVRRWRWAAAAARVFEAFHTKSGAPAVVLKPGRVGDWAPAAAPWSARVTSNAEQLAVELVPHPRGVAQLQEVTLGLHRLAHALAQVDTHPAAQAALAGDVAAARVWRAKLGVRPAYAVALAAACVLAVVAAPRVEHGWTRTAAPPESSPVQLAPLAPAEPLPLAVAPQRATWAAFAVPMPPKPFEGQVLAKAGKCERRSEQAINGGCWVKLDLKPPCDNDAYESKGACYLPSWPAMREPQTRR